jgi:osmoprotectant transport system substrate-binding protein
MKKVRAGLLLLTLVLVATACGSSNKSSGSDSEGSGEKITIGAANFAGARAVSQAYAQALEAEGFDVTFRDNVGTREQLYPLAKDGEINGYADFTGSLLTYLKGTPTGNADETYKAVQAKLEGTGLEATTPAEAQDVNGFYVTKETADKYELKTVSDLNKNDLDKELVFGGPPECQERPLCLGTTSQELYDLNFKEVKKLDAGGPITSKALQDGTIQVGLLFTASSVIDPDFVLLEDDKEMQPADNPTFVVQTSVVTDKLTEIIDRVNGALTVEAYNKMATSISEDKVDPSEAAATFLEDAGITNS